MSGEQCLAKKGAAFSRVELDVGDFGGSTLHMKQDAYDVGGFDASELSVDPGGLINDRDAWVSTTWDGFIQGQALLLKALVLCPPGGLGWPLVRGHDPFFHCSS